MSHVEGPEESQSAAPIRQDAKGSRNQVIGQARDSVIIGNAAQISIHSPVSAPSRIDEIKSGQLIPRSPYLGLRKFEIRDKDLFFGRAQLTARLLKRLEKNPFLLVLGASGSGKSSLVRAGLIPKLLETLGSEFRELIFTPDRDPFDSFRASLQSAGFRQADIEGLQTGKPETILNGVTSLKSEGEHWLIFIDQFEELFTLCQDLEQRQAFINGLIRLVQAKLASVRLVLAMRADFLDRLGAYPELSGILQRSELVTDMGNDELYLAIEQPAAHHGVVTEPGLTEEIILDLRGRQGAVGAAERASLPLLQYTLKLLWESSGDLSDRTLYTQTYRDLGGVKGALQRHVDEIYASMSEAQKQATKHIFLQLVDTTSADAGTTAVGKAVSRPAAQDDFSPSEQEVLQQLVNAGLLICDDPEGRVELAFGDRISPANQLLSASSHKATVELAHETLIDAWEPLKAWIEESRPLIRLKNQLKDDARRWQQILAKSPDQAEAELWQGSKLQHLLSQRQEIELRFGALSPEETAFIEACETLKDRQIRAEIEQQRQKKRLYRSLAAVSAAALALITGIAAFSVRQWQAADRGQIQALLASSEANFQRYPGSLDALLDSLRAGRYFQRSIWLRNDDQMRSQVMETLGQALYNARERDRLEGHEREILDLSFNPDDGTLVTVSYDNTLRLWNAQGTPQAVFELENQYPTSVGISPDGNWLAVGGYEGKILFLDMTGTPLIEPIEAHDGQIWDIAISPDGQTIATAGSDGALRFWTVEGKPAQAEPMVEPGITFRSVAFNKAGTQLLVGRSDGQATLLDNQGTVLHKLTGHSGDIYGVAFSPDGQMVATAGKDLTARMWDVDSGDERAILRGHLDEVDDLAFSPSGDTLATGSYDGTLKLWSREGTLLETLKGHTSGITAVEFSPDGTVLASASEGRTVRLWEPNPWLTKLVGHTSEVSSVDFDPAGDRVASSDREGNVNLWSAEGDFLNQVAIGRGFISNLRFSPNGQLLAIGNADGTISLLTHQGKPMSTLPMHQRYIQSLSFRPDSQALITIGDDQTIKLWDRAKNEITPLITSATPLRSIDWSSDKQMIAVATQDGIAQLFHPRGEQLQTFKAHADVVHKVTFSVADPNLLATASQDKTAKLWQLDGSLLTSLEGHEAVIWDVAFSPNGKLVATASGDNTVKLWTTDGKLITTLAGHTDFVGSVSFSPNGTVLASASSDNTGRLWNITELSLEGWLTQGCLWTQAYLVTTSQELPTICREMP